MEYGGEVIPDGWAVGVSNVEERRPEVSRIKEPRNLVYYASEQYIISIIIIIFYFIFIFHSR